MPYINLLPWREEQRKELKKQFITMLVLISIAAIAVWGAIHFYHTQLLQQQNRRIYYINEKIKILDQQLTKISALEEDKEHLLSRIRTIEELQRNRPLNVRLFDEIVKSLPEGVNLTALKQTENNIEITGLAQSNARVSSFMRKIDSSAWISDPELQVIKASNKNDKSTKSDLQDFQLRFTQVIPQLEDSAE